MQSTIEDLKGRRSVRKFKPGQVGDAELAAVLEAGTYAPSGMGAQSAIMVVVQDRETIGKLSAMNAAVMGSSGSDPFYGAPTVIVVLADRTRPTCIEDGSLVLGNLMNAAHAVGLGSCWIHRAREEFESAEGKALLRKWGVTGDYVGVGHCVLGYPAGSAPAARPRKPGYVVMVR